MMVVVRIGDGQRAEEFHSSMSIFLTFSFPCECSAHISGYQEACGVLMGSVTLHVTEHLTETISAMKGSWQVPKTSMSLNFSLNLIPLTLTYRPKAYSNNECSRRHHRILDITFCQIKPIITSVSKMCPMWCLLTIWSFWYDCMVWASALDVELRTLNLNSRLRIPVLPLPISPPHPAGESLLTSWYIMTWVLSSPTLPE